jgi:hypothetical protein
VIPSKRVNVVVVSPLFCCKFAERIRPPFSFTSPAIVCYSTTIFSVFTHTFNCTLVNHGQSISPSSQSGHGVQSSYCPLPPHVRQHRLWFHPLTLHQSSSGRSSWSDSSSSSDKQEWVSCVFDSTFVEFSLECLCESNCDVFLDS